MNTVLTYEIVDHGPDAESYFPGCGVAFTSFTEAFTGIGDTAGEALEDALGQAITSGDCIFTADTASEITSEWLETDWARQPAADSGDEVTDEWHYYVTIRVKFS